MQLATLLIGLISATALWSGVQALNQQARVDIMEVGADPFSVAAGDVLQSLLQTNPGDPAISGSRAGRAWGPGSSSAWSRGGRRTIVSAPRRWSSSSRKPTSRRPA